ncbi:class I SAM-dependent methyltransferase [Mycolicibacterium goodii]|uniref:class I SAM-dependent methyltransferase n=1 Tax=Mycolicibacterium goodii TaxID=134601 RepID=UPI001C20EF4A|nr:methyltransferase domain-containing protein [Mycolicibacterium goodii]ULN49516.1 class I SAM-dependent methyltransferase [Mycolicibacterium goodii]
MTNNNFIPAVDDSADDSAEFGARMLGAVNAASLALLLSIGHQTQLFDVMASMPPASSGDIADAAELNERYVREWLGGLVAADVIAYDVQTKQYRLPPAHAPALTRAGGPGNYAKMAQYVAILGSVEQRIVDCFRHGGGVGYEHFPRYHEVRAEQGGAVVDSGLLSEILPLVEGLPDRLTAGIDLADFGCGRGHAVNVMASAYPSSRFTGFDFADDALRYARDEASAMGLDNAGFAWADLAAIDVSERFDAILVIDAIHDQADPARVLSNIQRALRAGGVLLMIDIKASSNLEDNRVLPWATWLYTVSTMHCMTVSLADGGAGLGTVWGEQTALTMLHAAGFADVRVAEVPRDQYNSYFVAYKA